jgi:hypothetical protein
MISSLVVNGNYNKVTLRRGVYYYCCKVDNGQYNNASYSENSEQLEERFYNERINENLSYNNDNFSYNFVSNNRRANGNGDILSLFNLINMNNLYTNHFEELNTFLGSMNNFSNNINNVYYNEYDEIRKYTIELLPVYSFTQYLSMEPKNRQE